jgi:hypothetical protein
MGRNLKKGLTTSCGHVKRQRQSLIGQQFGELVVIDKAPDFIKKDGTHRISWHCRCSCGNELDVFADSLKSGNTKSCGHLQKQAASESMQAMLDVEPGTNLQRLNDRVYGDNTSCERNIREVVVNGYHYFEVEVGYKNQRYRGTRNTMSDAIALREEFRRKHWPNYPDASKE